MRMRKKIGYLLVVGAIMTLMMAFLYMSPAQAQGYPVDSTATGTGAELILFAASGMALIGAGVLLFRGSKS